jgi:hypothetical protein
MRRKRKGTGTMLLPWWTLADSIVDDVGFEHFEGQLEFKIVMRRGAHG